MKKDENGQWQDDPVHTWFGLTYSSYFVMPRMALQAMPLEWQRKFVSLMEEANATGIETPSYHVLRDDDEYTGVDRYDEDDEYSTISGLTVRKEDEWANYRHPDYSLLPDQLLPDHIKRVRS